MDNKKMKIRDIITVTLLTLCNLLIYSIGIFTYATPVTVLLTPVIYAILQGIVFFAIGVKVQKKGAFLLYCTIMGAVGFYPPYTILFIISGIVAEGILKKNGYGNLKAIGKAYVIQQALASIGSVIYPYGFSLKKTLKMVDDANVAKNISNAGSMISSWGALVLLVLVIFAAGIGANMGRRVVTKHFLTKNLSL